MSSRASKRATSAADGLTYKRMHARSHRERLTVMREGRVSSKGATPPSSMTQGHDASARVRTHGPCEACGRPASLRCSKCKRTRYCSRDCFRADWARHREVCASQLHSIQPPPQVPVASNQTNLKAHGSRVRNLRDLVASSRAGHNACPGADEDGAEEDDCPLMWLPMDVLLEGVLSRLGSKDIVRLGATSKRLRTVCNGDGVWRSLADKRGIRFSDARKEVSGYRRCEASGAGTGSR